MFNKIIKGNRFYDPIYGIVTSFKRVIGDRRYLDMTYELTSEGFRWIRELFCFPKLGLLQALTKKSDTQLLDTYNKGDAREVQQARAYEFAGSQYIDTGVKVQGQTPIDIKMIFTINDFDSYHGLFGCADYNKKGCSVRTNAVNGVLRFFISDGNGTNMNFYTSLTPSLTEVNVFSFTWSGISSEDVIFTLNGATETYSAPMDFTGDSFTSLLIGAWISTNHLFTGRIFNYSYTINGGDEVVYNCEERAGNTSYSTTSGVTADIYGSLTGFHVIEHRKTTCYLDSVGFAIDNANPDVAIPIGTDGTPVASYDTWYKGVVPKNVNFVNAGCFVNNNSDNICEGTRISITDTWGVGFIIRPRLGGQQYLTYLASYRNWIIMGDYITFRQIDGTYINTNILINEDRFYIIFINMYLDGTDKKASIYVDNDLKATIDITNDFYYSTQFNACGSGGVNSVKEIACYFRSINSITDEEALNWRGNPIKGGSNEILIPFINKEGTNNTVYDVNNNTAYSISGTITDGVSWITQDVYHNLEVNGYSDYSSLATYQQVLNTNPTQVGKIWHYENEVNKSNVKNVNIVCYGDSRTDGSGVTSLSYPEQLTANLDSKKLDVNIYNQGIGGYRSSQLIDKFNTMVTPLYDDNKDNYFIIMSGANDYWTNTAQETYDMLSNMINDAHNLGFITINLLNYPTSIIDRNDFLNELRILLLANPLGDYTIDTHDKTNLLDPTNTTYFLDGLHLTDAGNKEVADLLFDELFDNIITDNFTISGIQITNSTSLLLNNGKLRNNLVVNNLTDFDLTIKTLGIVSTSSNDVILSSNSTSNRLLIRTVNGVKIQVLIYNDSGEEIYELNYLLKTDGINEIYISRSGNDWTFKGDGRLDYFTDILTYIDCSNIQLLQSISVNILSISLNDNVNNSNSFYYDFTDNGKVWIDKYGNKNTLNTYSSVTHPTNNYIKPNNQIKTYADILCQDAGGVVDIATNETNEWIFEFQEYDVASTSYFTIMQDVQINSIYDAYNGYRITLYTDGHIRLYEITGTTATLVIYVAPILDMNVDYILKVTRSVAGEWFMYLNGSQIGHATNNTHTTGNYTTLMTNNILYKSIKIGGAERMYDVNNTNGEFNVYHFSTLTDAEIGFKDVGNKLLQPINNKGLYDLSVAESLGWYSALDAPIEIDYSDLQGYVDSLDFTIDNSNDIITNMKSKVSDNKKYPASLLNIGKDVNDYTLTHPPCEIGSNDGSQKQYPLAADLIHADTDEIYFDKTTPELVVARELDNADLPLDNDYTRWNAVDNCKMQGLMYDHDLTVEEQNQILKCYAKTNETIDFCRDTNGEIQYDTNGRIITC